jgi:hypothetical protein
MGDTHAQEFLLTQNKMQGYIDAGRNAIEYAMLLVLMRSSAQSKDDDAEMSELTGLLNKYNEMMAKHERSLLNAPAANDEQGVPS